MVTKLSKIRGDPGFLDFSKVGFSTRSDEVLDARARNWYAETPLGIAVLSYDHVGHLLRDRRLRQGSHNWPKTQMASGSFADFWVRSIISQEGSYHQKLRMLSVKALSEEFIQSLVPKFDNIAETLCKELKLKSKCEFQSEFAMPFSGQAICVLLGIPLAEWVLIAKDASTLGLAMGLNYKSNEARVNAACNRLLKLADNLILEAECGNDKEGLVGRLVLLGEKYSEIDREALKNLIVMLIFGGVDTTRSQLGFLMALFANNIDQWHTLRKDISLVPSAIEESIRAWPTTTWVTREAIETFVFDNVKILKGTILHMLVHSSSKDPKLGEFPVFDIKIKQKRHHGFGGGAHHCLGHLVARTDMAAALRALASTFTAFKLLGQPKYLPDSGNTSPQSLNLSFEI